MQSSMSWNSKVFWESMVMLPPLTNIGFLSFMTPHRIPSAPLLQYWVPSDTLTMWHTYIHACMHTYDTILLKDSITLVHVCVVCVCACVRVCACMSVCDFCEFKHFSTLCLKVAILKHRVPKYLILCKLHYIVWLTYALHTQVNHERVVVLSFKQHHACTHMYVHT